MDRIQKERYRYTPKSRLDALLDSTSSVPGTTALAEIDIEADNTLCHKSAATAADATDLIGQADATTHAEILSDPLVSDNLAAGDRQIQGVQIDIPDRFQTDGILYIHLRYPETGTASIKYRQRHTIRVGRNANVRVAIYHHPAARPEQTTVNALLLVDTAPGARIEIVEVAETRANYLSTTLVRQRRDSYVKSTTIDLDNTLMRRNQFICLAEAGAECQLEGTYITDGEQHCDNYIRMHHAVPNCTSNQLFKGVAEERSHAVFTGHVYVAPNAQQTVALQENHNIVMGDEARIDTRPQLEIYADDVKCNHGATIGRLDPEAIYYMRQRGISLDAAQRLQIEGFIDEIIDHSHIEELSHLLHEKVSKRLQTL